MKRLSIVFCLSLAATSVRAEWNYRNTVMLSFGTVQITTLAVLVYQSIRPQPKKNVEEVKPKDVPVQAFYLPSERALAVVKLPVTGIAIVP